MRSTALPVGLLALSFAFWAAVAVAAWQQELGEQMRLEHDCTVGFLSQVTEREHGRVLVVFAKVHCEDGRTFDASRTSADEPFVVKACPSKESSSC